MKPAQHLLLQPKRGKEKGNKSGRAVAVAKILEKMKKVKVTTVVFDREYRYHGRVKAIADTLREAGIQV